MKLFKLGRKMGHNAEFHPCSDPDAVCVSVFQFFHFFKIWAKVQQKINAVIRVVGIMVLRKTQAFHADGNRFFNHLFRRDLAVPGKM